MFTAHHCFCLLSEEIGASDDKHFAWSDPSNNVWETNYGQDNTEHRRSSKKRKVPSSIDTLAKAGRCVLTNFLFFKGPDDSVSKDGNVMWTGDAL